MDRVYKVVEELEDEIISWRRHFHKYPELSWKEYETSKFIAEQLRSWGYEVKDDFCDTAVLARKGKNTGKVILFRADMDALSLNEENDIPYKSQNRGIMHACAHDGHMAMLLGLAKLLSTVNPELNGSVLLCFQPAEEGGAGGEKLIQSGIMETFKVSEVYSIHIYTGVNFGIFICPDREFLASADEFKINIIGKGTHGALPHKGNDPIVAGASLILNLQSVISRNMNPLSGGVLTVGKFSSGSAFNIIPETAEIMGTFRAFTKEDRNKILSRIKKINRGTSEVFDVETELKIFASYPPTVNHSEQAEDFREAAGFVCSTDHIIKNLKIPVAEDFSFYLNKFPGAMAFLGACIEGRTEYPHHSPYFNFDEKILITGVKIFWNLLKNKLMLS